MMEIKYEIKHNHTRYVVYKDGLQLGTAKTKSDAQKMIEEDKAKRHQYKIVWLSKTSPFAQFIELEAVDETQAKIKIQQLHMNDFLKILKIERIS